jgi:hypothetical protein
MFTVTTINLTPDLRTAHLDLGSRDFGQVDANQLAALLERFREIDPVQNHDAQPRVIVFTPAGNFIIRTDAKKLFLHDSLAPAQSGIELDPARLADALESLATAPSAPAKRPAPSSRRLRNVATAALFAAGLALNAYTLHAFLEIDDVNRPAPVQLLTDDIEIAARTNAAAGRYATGRSEGDRIIEIDRSGRVRFFRITPTGQRPDSDDAFRIGRLDTKLCLATTRHGVIEILNIDTLAYHRDTYRRTR